MTIKIFKDKKYFLYFFPENTWHVLQGNYHPFTKFPIFMHFVWVFQIAASQRILFYVSNNDKIEGQYNEADK